MPTFISLDDHFLAESTRATPEHARLFRLEHNPKLAKQLGAIDNDRIEDMDAGDIAVQVVSSLPVDQCLEGCKTTNNQLARAAQRSKGRIAGFATVPMSDPSAAATELQRCVQELDFVGALIPNHADGTYYDGIEYRPFWAMAESLQVPVYLHPTPAHEALQETFKGNYSEQLSFILSRGGWGWHADTATHFLKLYASGLFDQFPTLKVILGHGGEMLPYMIGRIHRRISRSQASFRRSFPTVWQENVWVTLSGMWDLAPFVCLQRTSRIDHILFSVDYPFESNEAGAMFMEALRHSGLLTGKQWEMVAYGNAEKLLNLRRPSGA